MNPETRSALTGHSARLDESSQYGAGMGSFTRQLYDALAMVPSPVATPSVPPLFPGKGIGPGASRMPVGASMPPPGAPPLAGDAWRGCGESA